MATVKLQSKRDRSQNTTREGGTRSSTPTKRVCYFCESAKEPTYTDSVTLRKFMNDRTRIVSHLRSGVCSKHQRHLTKEIKRARHLALLPFIPSI